MKKQSVKRLYFDIEVSPDLVRVWSAGYKQKVDYNNIVKERAIICICYKWEGEKQVHELHWDSKHSDKLMLQQFLPILNEADEIIAHNGDKFDLPWLRTRCLYHRIPMFPNYTSLDTLQKSRSKFKFNSNTLNYLGKFLLGEGKASTGEYLWTKVENDVEGSLDKMVRYCKKDVKLLEKVYKELAPYITNHVHHAVLNGGSKCQCPECSSKNVKLSKRRVTLAGTVKVQMQCKSCSKYFTITNKLYEDNFNK